MEKIKNLKIKMGLYRPDIKQMCVIGMLIALTVVLGMYCTIRIGTGIKISLKFVSVYILSAFFGPVWGGISCVISDILAYFVNPVAAFLPQITFSEFLYGFTDGIFYYRRKTFGKNMILRIILCVMIETVFINIFLTSYFLTSVMGLGYKELILMRLPAALLTLAVKICLLIPLSATASKMDMINV